VEEKEKEEEEEDKQEEETVYMYRCTMVKQSGSTPARCSGSSACGSRARWRTSANSLRLVACGSGDPTHRAQTRVHGI